MSKSPKEVVLEVLRSSKIDLSMGEIRKLTRLSSPTVSKWVEVLKAQGSIVATRRVGRATFYAIARGSLAPTTDIRSRATGRN